MSPESGGLLYGSGIDGYFLHLPSRRGGERASGRASWRHLLLTIGNGDRLGLLQRTGYGVTPIRRAIISAVEPAGGRPSQDPWAKLFLGLMLLWAATVPLFIAVAESAMWLAALVWAIAWVRHEVLPGGAANDPPVHGPAGDVFGLIGAPVIGYCAASLLSATMSRDPIDSLWEVREVFLFVAPMVTYAAFREPRARRWAIRAFTAGIFITLAWGLVQTARAAQSGTFPGTYRPDGPFSHYMTYAGMLMLAVPLLLAVRNGVTTLLVHLLAAVALAMVGLTMTRSAWLGCVVTLIAYVGCGLVPARVKADRRPARNWAAYGVTLAVGGIVISLLLLSLAGQQALVARGSSIFSMQNPTNVDRMAMAVTGLRIIAAYPVLGIGPGLMGKVYPAWRVPWAVKEHNSHLHNNLLQIAAERGLLGLALWLWMMAAFVIGGWRVLRHRGPHGEGGPEARAALAAAAGFLIMGLFEYNFSDSEVLMALLFILTLPFAASAQTEHQGR
ncbi:MAG: O-antigen ligase family protein [Acidobacteriota bacterium]